MTLADMRWLAGKTGKTEAEAESSDLMEESGLELFEGLDEGAEVSDRLKVGGVSKGEGSVNGRGQ